MSNTEEDFEFQDKYKNVFGHYPEACNQCKRYVKAYHDKKKQVKPQQKDFMKKVCKDCALEECDLYLRSKRLGLSETWKELGLSDNINNLKTNCDRALRRAERVCKY